MSPAETLDWLTDLVLLGAVAAFKFVLVFSATAGAIVGLVYAATAIFCAVLFLGVKTIDGYECVRWRLHKLGRRKSP